MSDTPVRPVPFPLPNPLRPVNGPLLINTLAEYAAHQAEIVQRISAMRNGATLFSIHPVQAMLDVNVTLAAQAAKDVWAAMDTIAIPVPAAYRELMKATAAQRVTTTLTVPAARGAQ